MRSLVNSMCGGYTGEHETMLSYSEMLAVIDRHTSTLSTGRNTVFIGGVREELFYEWDFDELQVQRIIYDMQDAKLLW